MQRNFYLLGETIQLIQQQRKMYLLVDTVLVVSRQTCISTNIFYRLYYCNENLSTRRYCFKYITEKNESVESAIVGFIKGANIRNL